MSLSVKSLSKKTLSKRTYCTQFHVLVLVLVLGLKNSSVLVLVLELQSPSTREFIKVLYFRQQTKLVGGEVRVGD